MSKVYRIGEFAKHVGKSTSTLRRWDNDGIFPTRRTLGGHRYYVEADVYRVLGWELPEAERKVVVYCRVSSRSQKDDLQSQVEAMRQFCIGGGIAVDVWIEEFGGGMNFKRPQFLSLIERIENREIKRLIIAHKDRLVRFGFEFFSWLAQRYDCEITVVNQEQLSPQQEMVEDLMAIIHTFSCRLYGLRSYKKKIKEAAELSE